MEFEILNRDIKYIDRFGSQAHNKRTANQSHGNEQWKYGRVDSKFVFLYQQFQFEYNSVVHTSLTVYLFHCFFQ